MKKINATTSYNPALSDMQEVEYTMPQSKKEITECLMSALDNLATADSQIAELLIALEAMNHPRLNYIPALDMTVDELLNKHKVK